MMSAVMGNRVHTKANVSKAWSATPESADHLSDSAMLVLWKSAVKVWGV